MTAAKKQPPTGVFCCESLRNVTQEEPLTKGIVRAYALSSRKKVGDPSAVSSSLAYRSGTGRTALQLRLLFCPFCGAVLQYEG